MSDPTLSDIGFKNKMVRYELPLILTKNGIPCENPSKNHGFDVRSLERDENSEPRPRNIFASLAHNTNSSVLGFLMGRNFSFKLMSDQEGLKGGDINTAFK